MVVFSRSALAEKGGSGAEVQEQLLILDSAATEHVFPSHQDFMRYSTTVLADKRHVRTADGRAHPVLGVGQVKVALKKGTSVEEVLLNALHVPSLGQHLVSLDCLNKRGGVGFQLSERGCLGCPGMAEIG